jgi:lipopolysaccharide transport system ATP-binding protein
VAGNGSLVAGNDPSSISHLPSTASKEEFWALKDVSFEVKRGEVVGIIGRNGAGKSTLLKILSRITEPTEGRVTLRGRVASLLEVGTGFHPELTGRENIFLNGAILGMTKAEIKKKFDEIVAFAEVERFLDTPVKRYSSGMYVRLAFAVAAHLEPEILVVDEVLAVGDAEFQKKCLGKMKDVATGGRTVLFVSHNMLAVRSLCEKALVLNKGTKVAEGTANECIKAYSNQKNDIKSNKWRTIKKNKKIGLEDVSLRIEGRQPDLNMFLDCKFIPIQTDQSFFLAFDISNSDGSTVMQAIPEIIPIINITNSGKKHVFKIEIGGLIPDKYSLSIWMGPHNTQTYDFEQNIIEFEILESPTKGRTFPHTKDHGFFVPKSYYLPNE